ncbi:hypothetical protein V6N13_063823 [Hibiscus sabdariffa]
MPTDWWLQCSEPVIPLYAIAIDPRNPSLFAVVGLYQYARLYDICKYKCGGSTDFGQPIDYFYPPHDMGLGHNLVPFSPSSSCSEANGNGTPQVYKGHKKKETVDSKKGGELVDAKKEHVLEADCIEPHPHTTVMASSGADGIKIWTPNAIDKGKLATTKIEQDQLLSFVNSIWSPYLDAICSTARQNCGTWMRLDTIDLEYVLFRSTNKFSSFLLPNVYSAIVGSTNQIL